jgi:hypothetical protein
MLGRQHAVAPGAEFGAEIIEINVEPSNFTDCVTDIFLQGKAGTIMSLILEKME